MPQLVSILIPVFNAEKWIRESIQSAVDQTWPRKEIIIVDDGSTDNSFRIARGFESKSVKALSQENRGASAARNAAFRLAQGDYIQWLDADDLLAPDKIECQMRAGGDGRETRILLSAAWGRFYFRKKKAAFSPQSLWRDLSPLDWLLAKFNHNAWQNPGAWLISRRLAELSGMWDERLSYDDDGEYFCRVVRASEKVAFVPEAKTYYRIGNTGSLSWSSDTALDSLFLSTILCIHHLLSLRDDPETRSACVRFLQHRFFYFYPKRKFVDELNRLAEDLGGTALSPEEGWKFRLMRKTVGRKAAGELKTIASKTESEIRKNWDRLMHVLFERNCSGRRFS